MTYEFTELLTSLRIVDIFAGYLGERPALSIGKTTLRRVPKTLQLTGWHQDGAFLGKGIRSVNLWLCLSPCGEDAPGLEIVPRRLDHIVETGTHGTFFDWSVGDAMVERVAGNTPVIGPLFGPGDALLFDELLLHRTSLPPKMTRDRYADRVVVFRTVQLSPSTRATGGLKVASACDEATHHLPLRPSDDGRR